MKRSAWDLRGLAVVVVGMGIAAIIACEGSSPVSGGQGGSGGQSSTRARGGSGGIVGSQGQSSRNGGGGAYCYGMSIDYGCSEPLKCRDGVVTEKSVHNMISCSVWTGSCPATTAGTCKRGCAFDTIDGWDDCPMTICRENYPKHIGDPCTQEFDCQPSVLYPAYGGSWETHLSCDLENGKCVETALPEMSDWLAPCDAAFIKQYVDTGQGGAFRDSTCSGDVCYFQAPRGETCVYQGCTRPCSKDEECPAGAVCQIYAGCPSPDSFPGYCKPGERNDFSGVGLTCL